MENICNTKITTPPEFMITTRYKIFSQTGIGNCINNQEKQNKNTSFSKNLLSLKIK